MGAQFIWVFRMAAMRKQYSEYVLFMILDSLLRIYFYPNIKGMADIKEVNTIILSYIFSSKLFVLGTISNHFCAINPQICQGL